MDELVTFSRTIQGELPFVLNVPEGQYAVRDGSLTYVLDLFQGWVAVQAGPNAMIAGAEQELRKAIGEGWDALYKHHLRTVVRHQNVVQRPRSELPIPNEEQLFAAAQQHLLRHGVQYHPGPEQLQADARRSLAELSAEDRAAFGVDTSVRLEAERLFRPRDVEAFCRAVNVFVRLYMAKFNDFFVEEVNERLFSGTAFQGIQVVTFCNGHRVEAIRHVGSRFPFILRRPWLEHPPQAIEQFRTSLGASPDPDPVTLLSVRARAFLVRGGFRSALIEASAALDLCLVRTLRRGFLARGKLDAEIETLLSLNDNRRFDQRAKRLLKDATGHSAAELDAPLWERVIAHRGRRGSVAHTEKEPTQAEATEGVEDMLRLVGLLDALP